MIENSLLNIESLKEIWPSIVWPFILAAVFVAMFTPGIVKIAKKAGLLDPCNDRKVHKTPIPRLGGVVFITSSVFAFLFASLSESFDDLFILQIQANIQEIFALYLAMAMMFLIGFKDDLVGVRYNYKFCVQILASLIFIYLGIKMPSFYGFLGIGTLHPVVASVITILIFVLIVNSINLIDGIDGLAATICLVGLVYYCAIFLMAGNLLYASMCICVTGSLLPYLYFNMNGGKDKKYKLFMGDTGSLSLGVLMAFLSIRICTLPLEDAGINTNPLILAFTPLAIPILDLVRVFLIRIYHGHSPFSPDKNHIHHKLLKLGFNQNKAWTIIILYAIFLIAINIFISDWLNVNFLVLLDVTLWIAPNIFLTKFITRAKTE